MSETSLLHKFSKTEHAFTNYSINLAKGKNHLVDGEAIFLLSGSALIFSLDHYAADKRAYEIQDITTLQPICLGLVQDKEIFWISNSFNDHATVIFTLTECEFVIVDQLDQATITSIENFTGNNISNVFYPGICRNNDFLITTSMSNSTEKLTYVMKILFKAVSKHIVRDNVRLPIPKNLLYRIAGISRRQGPRAFNEMKSRGLIFEQDQRNFTVNISILDV